MEILKFALLGYPLTYSLSPLIFGRFFAYYKIYGKYELLPIRIENYTEEDLFRLFKEKGIKGVNITRPYKEFFAKYGDEIAGKLLSVNVFDIEKRKGISADYLAFFRLLKKIHLKSNSKVLILGAGNIARLSVYTLYKWKGIKNFSVLNRTKSRVDEMEKFLKKLCDSEIGLKTKFIHYDVVINTVPLEKEEKRKIWDYFSLDSFKFSKYCWFIDWIYLQNRITYFLDKAREKRYNYIRGEEILLEQAVESFRFLTGLDIPDRLKEEVKLDILKLGDR